MDIIKLTTKPDTFADLKAGLIRDYAREIRPNTQAKYCDLDEDGYVKDIDGVLQPRHYDVVTFLCGHDSVSFKIENAQIELFEDEHQNLITYTENGEEYIAAQIVYFLGEKILV